MKARGSRMSHVYKLYFGSSLFDHKDLIGNALLASYLEKRSEGRYRCFLPQTLPQENVTAVDIRNQDIKQILECDLALFNFEGTELDAGTVVEFIFAKLLDIPSVIMRSDFRSSGEKELGGDDWNLMCSFYPRTHVVQFNAIEFHQQAMNESRSLEEAMDRLYLRITSLLIESLDLVIGLPPVFRGDRGQLEGLYQWALRFPGGGLENLCSEAGFIENIVAAKIEKKIYR
jgi:nucleoside 2-deoxyribosyltransferase